MLNEMALARFNSYFLWPVVNRRVMSLGISLEPDPNIMLVLNSR